MGLSYLKFMVYVPARIAVEQCYAVPAKQAIEFCDHLTLIPSAVVVTVASLRLRAPASIVCTLLSCASRRWCRCRAASVTQSPELEATPSGRGADTSLWFKGTVFPASVWPPLDGVRSAPTAASIKYCSFCSSRPMRFSACAHACSESPTSA